jgi:hypothetical protein
MSSDIFFKKTWNVSQSYMPSLLWGHADLTCMVKTRSETAGATYLSLELLREHPVASFVWRKEILII